MGFQTYSGTWLRGAYTDPTAATVHTADPAHAGGTGEDPGGYAYQAPELPAVDPYLGQYPGSEWVVATPPTVIDRTVEGPQGDRGHADDEGAPLKSVYTPPVTQFFNERYEHDRFEGLGSPAGEINPVALQRGLNSYAANNPEGFNPGHVEQSWVSRKFFVGRRVHDQRIVTPNVPAVAADTAPVPTPTGSPFSSMARAMKRNYQTPAMRRTPPPMSQDLEVEPGQYSAYPSWVVV